MPRVPKERRAINNPDFGWLDEKPLKEFREPMLSAKIDDKDIPNIQWPQMLSTKIDGVRAVFHGKALLSRSMKRIPNLFVQKTIREIAEAFPVNIDRDKVNLIWGMDGELVVGPPNAPDVFNRTTSGVMSVHGEPDFTWLVFDRYDQWEGGSNSRPRGRYFLGDEYHKRYETIKAAVAAVGHPRLQLVEHTQYNIPTSLEIAVQWALDNGWEGLMLNNPLALYHCGRPSLKMNILAKYKPFETFEAEILDIFEQRENTNEAFDDERGRSKRSSAKNGKVGKGTMGGFTLRACDTGVEFNCGMGPGLTANLRQYIWDNPSQYIGQLALIRKQKVGEVNKPRIPQYMGLRSRFDLSPK